MMLYNYKCYNCGYYFSDGAVDAPDCPSCKSDKTGMVCNIAIHGNYKHPIHSDALAIHPDQRAEHEKMFPNIRLDGQNRPIFDNFVDHQSYLDKCGLVKLRQKTKMKEKNT